MDNISHNQKTKKMIGAICLDDLNLAPRIKINSEKLEKKQRPKQTYNTIPDESTTLSELNYSQYTYGYYKSYGPEKYLDEINRLERLKKKGFRKVLIKKEDGSEKAYSINSEIGILDKLIEKSVLCWGGTYYMHHRVEPKFEKWSEDRKNGLYSRINGQKPPAKSEQTKFIESHSDDYSPKYSLFNRYCTACQETPCHCSDPWRE